MDIPKLKRITVTSDADLRAWLARHRTSGESVMLVTRARRGSPNHVSRAEVGAALAAQGWVAGPRYTLNGSLIGHVIHPRSAASSR